MGATPQDLPFDLISQIILRLTNDRQSLRSMALTCKLLNRDATRLLYNTYLLIKLGDRPRRDDPSRGFLTTITGTAGLAMLIQSVNLNFNGLENGTLCMHLLPAALEAMENLINLEVIHNVLRPDDEEGDVDEEAIKPLSVLRAPDRYRFRLKRLTWTSHFSTSLIRELCEILVLHRLSLEAVGISLEGLADINSEDSHTIMKQYVWGFSPGEPIVTAHQPTPSRMWPLPSLRTLICCPRVLDIFAPIFNPHRLKDITMQFPTQTLCEPAVIPQLREHIFHYMGRSHLTRLYLDFVRCTEFKLQELTPYLRHLETIELHRPEIKLTANNIMSTFGCLENLRSLYVTRKSISRNTLPKGGVDFVNTGFKIFMHNNIQNFVPRIFVCCPNLYQAQFEIHFKEDPGSIHYRRWRRATTPIRGKGGLSSRSLDASFRSSISMGAGIPLFGEAGTLIA
ncbi:hypothetical protein BJ165DRAFT_1410296 [Panaeolus papilionaceus]|nr:hypothetical protein BJ165DRAFT_1410296 [Panaeolus papilionaceus]